MPRLRCDAQNMLLSDLGAMLDAEIAPQDLGLHVSIDLTSKQVTPDTQIELCLNVA